MTHSYDRTVIIGLTGEAPDRIDPDRMDAIVEEVERSHKVTPPGHPAYHFNPKEDLVFDKKVPLSGHANGMRLSALDKDGRVLLTDFGIAYFKHEEAELDDDLVSGTPAYFAPEVARGSAPGDASDVYSLGATIYTMVEGEPPFGVSAIR